MKRYLDIAKWTDDQRAPLEALFVEVGEDGWVAREVGLDEAGRVVYKFPWPARPSFRGSCDMATFATEGVPDAITPEQFERYWAAPLDEAEELRWIQLVEGPSLASRLRAWLSAALQRGRTPGE
jgi:hypothetical protein